MLYCKLLRDAMPPEEKKRWTHGVGSLGDEMGENSDLLKNMLNALPSEVCGKSQTSQWERILLSRILQWV